MAKNKRPKIKKQIIEAANALKEVMAEGMAEIAGNYISQIMKNYRSLPESRRFDATKNLIPKGTTQYRENLLKAMAVVAAAQLDQVKSEIPKKVKLAEWDEERMILGEFELLPAAV